MSRAAILSTAGDPFVASLVLKLWQEHWYDEIDRIYVALNNHAGVPKEVIAEFLANISKDPKVHAIYHPTGVGNGTPIKEGALVSQEDLILLLEDDGFCFTPGMIDFNFNKIEKGSVDAVGSPRFSCGMDVAEALKNKYQLDYSGFGDKGPNSWPNFFFCKREDLLNTDLNFASKEFTKGVYYPELDFTMKETEYADTFGWATMQMRHRGVRFGEVPQFHASPTEITDKERHEMNWRDGDPYWMHGGSLSSGWGGYLSGQLPPNLGHESGILEIETRCAWWSIAADLVEGFEEFKREYQSGIETLIVNGNLDRARIAKKIEIYRNLLKL